MKPKSNYKFVVFGDTKSNAAELCGCRVSISGNFEGYAPLLLWSYGKERWNQ
jgi:hypothetical protein